MSASANRIPTLQMIYAKVRRLTGSADTLQLPDTPNTGDPYSVGISDYINSFYNYDFPAQFRSLKLKDNYTFNTIKGISNYAFDSEHYTTIEGPVYCSKRQIYLFEDKQSFFRSNYVWQSQTNFATGNGTNGTPTPYSGFTTGSPIMRSYNNNPVFAVNPNYPASQVQNILITANTANPNTSTVNVTDDGFGNLIEILANGTVLSAGLINYQTGEITNLTFSQAIPQGNAIQILYNPIQETTPTSILFFQNQFTLAPTPDQGYTIELVAYRQPSQALTKTAAAAGNPELSEWWECIAIGAAKKIYEDRLDFDGVALMDKMLKERYQTAYTRTYAQLGKQRVGTIYAAQLQDGYGFGMGAGAGFGPAN